MAQQELTRTPDSAATTTEATRPERQLTPPVDIFENEEQLLLVADLPGVDPGGLTVDLEPPELRIEGRPAGGDEPAVVYRRNFTLNDAIDPEGISASIDNGVLSVVLKKSSAHRPRKIQVKAA